MDPITRSRIWNLLKKYKEDHIIIISTHLMEEAEILGDRIGIMKSKFINKYRWWDCSLWYSI